LKVYGFILTELFLDEKLTSSFGSGIAVSSTSLNLLRDILGVRVGRGRIEYDLWIGFGIKPLVYGAGREAGNGERPSQSFIALIL
jgi:hypothetical protein